MAYLVWCVLAIMACFLIGAIVNVIEGEKLNVLKPRYQKKHQEGKGMSKAIWKDIPGYKGLYQISSLGQVLSKARFDAMGRYVNEKIRRLAADKDGYLQVVLNKNGVKKTFKVHRLVAEAFIPNPHNYPQINHKDENVKNNEASNLEWCTAKYNCNYGGHTAKQILTTSKPVLQFDLHNHFVKRWPSTAEAGRHGFNQGSISNCCNGRQRTAYGFIWKYEGRESHE